LLSHHVENVGRDGAEAGCDKPLPRREVVSLRDPFRDLEEMGDRMNRVFGGFGRPGFPRASEAGREALTVPDWAPMVDITETNDEYLIKAEIHEVKREDVKVSVENGVLTMQGERKQEKEEKGKKFHRVEAVWLVCGPSQSPTTWMKRRCGRSSGRVVNVHLPRPKPKPMA
jgi:HSP20 family protein